jgi:uracil-DNA glycosylase
LAFGNTGLKYFSGKDGGITEFNGCTEWSEKENAWICYCIHPASVLRNPNNRILFEEGIKNFSDRIEILGDIQ